MHRTNVPSFSEVYGNLDVKIMGTKLQRSKSVLRSFAILPDIPPLHQTESKKILNGFTQALVATSLREKNELLANVENLWTNQNEKFEQIQAGNKIKRDELNNFKARLRQMTEDKNALRQNTSFFDYLSRRKLANSGEKLVILIKSKEEEIQQFQMLNYKNLLDSILETDRSTDTDYFKLLDLNLRRAEELAYSYKKRLDQVERSQESSEVMIKEFGSIHEMINQANSLAIENEVLKREESDFVSDRFLRRWKIALAPASALRDFAIVLRSLFESQTALLEQFDNPPSVALGSAFDFEAFSRDAQFALEPEQIDLAEFGTSVDADEMAKFQTMTTTAEKVQMLRRVIQITEGINAKMAGDLPPVNPRLIVPGTTRIEKLTEDNQRLMLRIQDAQVRLENVLGESEVLTKKVVSVMREREGYFQRYITFLKDMTTLTNAHILVQNCQAQNRAIADQLFHLSSVMGIDVFRRERDGPDSDFLRRKFGVAFDEYRELHPVVIEKVEVEVEPKEDEPPVLDPFALLKVRKKRVRKGKKSRHSVGTPLATDRDYSSTIRSSPGENPDWGAQELNQTDLLCRLALSIKLGGFLINERRDFYGLVTGKLKSVGTTLSREVRELTQAQQTEMQSQLTNINYHSQRMLVKQKCHVAIQTGPIKKLDIEVQTGNPPTPPEHAARPKKK